MAEEHVYREKLNLIAPQQRTLLGHLFFHVFLMPDGSIQIDQQTRSEAPFTISSLQQFLTEIEKAELVAKRDAAAQGAGDFYSYMVAMAVEHGWRIRSQ